jgi:Uma2 family endonuclease
MATVMTGLSVEEFRAGDWPPGTQLVDGEVVVNDPTFGHQEIVARILEALRVWARRGSHRGTAGIGGNWILAPSNLYIPDVWWAAEGNAPDREASSSERAPDLVAEVRSAGTWRHDIGAKRAVYERSGVRELWLVDTPASTVLVYRRSSPTAPAFDVDAEVAPGEVLASPLLEDFELSLEELFDGGSAGRQCADPTPAT